MSFTGLLENKTAGLHMHTQTGACTCKNTHNVK